MTSKLILAALVTVYTVALTLIMALGGTKPACAMSFTDPCSMATGTVVVPRQPKVWIVGEHDTTQFDAVGGDTINVVMDGDDAMEQRCLDMGGRMLPSSMVCWNVDF